MKIYNKKTFAEGAVFTVLGTGLLLICMLDGAQAKNVILGGLCAMIGVGFLVRAFSRELSRKDKLEEREERNRLIALKSGSKSHLITQIGCEVIMILFCAMGRVSGNRELIGIGLGAAFCFAVSLFAELFTKLYYEKRN